MAARATKVRRTNRAKAAAEGRGQTVAAERVVMRMEKEQKLGHKLKKKIKKKWRSAVCDDEGACAAGNRERERQWATKKPAS